MGHYDGTKGQAWGGQRSTAGYSPGSQPHVQAAASPCHARCSPCLVLGHPCCMKMPHGSSLQTPPAQREKPGTGSNPWLNIPPMATVGARLELLPKGKAAGSTSLTGKQLPRSNTPQPRNHSSSACHSTISCFPKLRVPGIRTGMDAAGDTPAPHPIPWCPEPGNGGENAKSPQFFEVAPGGGTGEGNSFAAKSLHLICVTFRQPHQLWMPGKQARCALRPARAPQTRTPPAKSGPTSPWQPVVIHAGISKIPFIKPHMNRILPRSQSSVTALPVLHSVGSTGGTRGAGTRGDAGMPPHGDRPCSVLSHPVPCVAPPALLLQPEVLVHPMPRAWHHTRIRSRGEMAPEHPSTNTGGFGRAGDVQASRPTAGITPTAGWPSLASLGAPYPCPMSLAQGAPPAPWPESSAAGDAAEQGWDGCRRRWWHSGTSGRCHSNASCAPSIGKGCAGDNAGHRPRPHPHTLLREATAAAAPGEGWDEGGSELEPLLSLCSPLAVRAKTAPGTWRSTPPAMHEGPHISPARHWGHGGCHASPAQHQDTGEAVLCLTRTTPP